MERKPLHLSLERSLFHPSRRVSNIPFCMHTRAHTLRSTACSRGRTSHSVCVCVCEPLSPARQACGLPRRRDPAMANVTLLKRIHPPRRKRSQHLPSLFPPLLTLSLHPPPPISSSSPAPLPPSSHLSVSILFSALLNYLYLTDTHTHMLTHTHTHTHTLTHIAHLGLQSSAFC